ncbi:4-amino-4-deoxy-L-arabinose-phosphoundecaprenol flippase subunit ArnF [Leucothrix arctica]|uniref:4-amino-4-deoxy-L-arabinose-phospho-UDP flippase n=1 Tax=Leucothrix arctica TaxID=1481894 RepID=A0A317CB01_9GAMM|nr:4-amino-4-deoxy-L-arabinose-phosphoundecaprenol flippase subunit ArnF [Leucothrix arctica]PWQ95728.1 4-amino-4-deoxy-L-arabinose-phospho-UDP flippase [Leucothrix arctica]
MSQLIAYVTASIMAGAIGQLMMKLGIQQLSPLQDHVYAFFTAFTVPALIPVAWVAAGIACYLVAMLLWLKVLRALPLSMAYPLLSLGYIVVYLGAYFIPALEESLTRQKTMGIALIIVGVIVIASKPKGVAHE